MIKFGRMTHPGENIVKEIKKTKHLGFDFVEIGIEAPTDASALRKNKSSIQKMLKEFNNPPLGHTSWWYELGSPYDSVRKGWIEQAKIDIEIASELGIKLLNFHFKILSRILRQHEKSLKLISDNYVKSLRELSKFAKKKDIVIMLENVEGNFEYYKYVLDKVPEIKFHFDVGHAFILDGMPEIRKFGSYFRERIVHIHVHDNNGKEDQHLGLGKGSTKWKEVVSLLKKIEYDRTITFEVFTSDKDLVKSMEYFRRLWYA